MRETQTKKYWYCVIYLLAAAVIVVADQIFKSFIVNNIELGGQLKLIPGVIHLTYVRNFGAAFSILQDMRWFFIVITVLASALIIWAIFKRKFKGWGLMSLAFIMGGAIGNAIDRAIQGYVVDMFEVEFMEYAVFNLADCFIVVGGILFIVYYLFFDGKYKESIKAKKQKEPENTEDEPENRDE